MWLWVERKRRAWHADLNHCICRSCRHVGWCDTPAGLVRLAASVGLSQLGRYDDGTQLLPRLRFPAKVIEHAVWLYHPFSLGLRDVELILAARRSGCPGRRATTAIRPR